VSGSAPIPRPILWGSAEQDAYVGAPPFTPGEISQDDTPGTSPGRIPQQWSSPAAVAPQVDASLAPTDTHVPGLAMG
jgi:hypothetical protein